MNKETMTILRRIYEQHDIKSFTQWCTSWDSQDLLEELKGIFELDDYWEPSKLGFEDGCRLLYNRIVGKVKRYRKFSGDPLRKAMDINKKEWRRLYDGYFGVDEWLDLVYDVNDTLQQHGHDGVWGGEISWKKAESGYAYRTLYHDNRKAAYNEEFYSFLFGWW